MQVACAQRATRLGHTAALQLSLAFLALTPLQDHCTMLRAFKLSDLELSIWNDFPVLFDRGEAGALRSDFFDGGRGGGRTGPGMGLPVSTSDDFTLSSSPQKPVPN